MILDMCAAPGGKTNHLASLTNNDATIIACDKGRRKMITAGRNFKALGATCIVPLQLNSTNNVIRDGSKTMSVKEVSLPQMCLILFLISLSGVSFISHVILRYFPMFVSISQQIIEKANASSEKDGLLNIKGFYPETFDKFYLIRLALHSVSGPGYL